MNGYVAVIIADEKRFVVSNLGNVGYRRPGDFVKLFQVAGSGAAMIIEAANRLMMQFGYELSEVNVCTDLDGGENGEAMIEIRNAINSSRSTTNYTPTSQYIHDPE